MLAVRPLSSMVLIDWSVIDGSLILLRCNAIRMGRYDWLPLSFDLYLTFSLALHYYLVVALTQRISSLGRLNEGRVLP
jgi:hypothetical protein